MISNKKGHTNPSFTDDNLKAKPLPPVDRLPPIDNRTNDMYFIDDSPYDRVDFSSSRAALPKIKESSSRPVPTKRKTKAPANPPKVIPPYDDDAESVNVWMVHDNVLFSYILGVLCDILKCSIIDWIRPIELLAFSDVQ